MSRSELGGYYDQFVRRYRIKLFFNKKKSNDALALNDPALHGIRIPNPSWKVPVNRGEHVYVNHLEHVCKEAFLDKVNEFYSKNHKNVRKILSHKTNDILHTLANLDNVIWKASDKNLGLTLMDLSWYRSRCYDILYDADVYEEFDKTGLTTFIISAEQSLKELYTRNGCQITQKRNGKYQISHGFKSLLYFSELPLEVMLRSVKECDQVVPIFYGLPKLHKNPIKLRPIVACHSWITTMIGNFVTKELLEICKLEPFICASSRDCLRQLQQHGPFEPGSILVTADVVSLYPSIPRKDLASSLGYAIANICYKHDKKFDSSYIKFLTELIDWMHKFHLVEFEELMFKQISGTAMGINVAPVLANLYMYLFWRNAIRKAEEKFNLTWSFSLNFIDDGFQVLPPCAILSIDKIFAFFNKQIPSIKLTFSYSRQSVNFLDLNIYFDEDHNLTTKLHVKALNRFLYIPFKSAHPMHQLKAWIKAESLRIVVVSGTHENFVHSFHAFVENLRIRGYPDLFLIYIFNELPRYSLEYRQSLLEPRTEDSKQDLFDPHYTVPMSIRTTADIASAPSAIATILKDTLEENSAQLGPFAMQKTNLKPMVSLRRGKNIKQFLVKSKHWQHSNLNHSAISNLVL